MLLIYINQQIFVKFFDHINLFNKHNIDKYVYIHMLQLIYKFNEYLWKKVASWKWMKYISHVCSIHIYLSKLRIFKLKHVNISSTDVLQEVTKKYTEFMCKLLFLFLMLFCQLPVVFKTSNVQSG